MLGLGYFEGGKNSSLLLPHHRFVIARHAPEGVAETGLLPSVRRKNPTTYLRQSAGHLLPSRFENKRRRIAPFR
jgi:hypothetical protein